MENDRYILRSITDEIMYEIMRLSGPGVRRHLRRACQGGVQARRVRECAGRRAEEGVLTRLEHFFRGATDPAAVAVEDSLFRALAVLRWIVLVNAVVLNVYRWENVERALLGTALVAVLVVWTVLAGHWYADHARRRWPLLCADLGLAVTALALTPLVKGADFNASVPGFWVMAPLLAWAAHWRWQGGLVAGVVLAATDLVVRQEVSQSCTATSSCCWSAGRSWAMRRRCSRWPSSATAPSGRPRPPASGPGWPGPCTTACCRCWRWSSDADASWAATAPSWAGSRASRRRSCAR